MAEGGAGAFGIAAASAFELPALEARGLADMGRGVERHIADQFGNVFVNASHVIVYCNGIITVSNAKNAAQLKATF